MRQGRDYWSRQVAAWRRSGQSKKAYCEKHGVSYWSLRHWAAKLAAPAAPEGQRLVELLYGRSSEQLSVAERLQMRLFDEIETSADSELPEDEPAAAARTRLRQRLRQRRKPLPQSLPRVERIIDLPEEQQQCACGHRLVRIGEESAEKLDVIPPRVQVIRTLRPKYACHHCEGSGDEQHPAVRVAPAAPALIPKGLASEGLLAFIAKFCDALPLYRQEQQFARLGVELSRRTMSDWMIAVAGACVPLLEALNAKLRAGPNGCILSLWHLRHLWYGK